MKIYISPSLPLFLFSVAISDKPHFAVITALAAALHELGHILAARSIGIPIKSLRLSVFGASIETDALTCSYGKEIFLSLCGPASNIFWAFVSALAFGLGGGSLFFITVSLFLAFLNLIPAGSFDGGRILSCVLCSFLSPTIAHRVSEAVSFLCIFVLWTTSVYFILKTGAYLSLFIFSCSLFSRIFIFDGKFSARWSR